MNKVLVMAAREGYKDVVLWSLDRGADVNIVYRPSFF